MPEDADLVEQRAFVSVAAMICDQPPHAREQDLQHRSEGQFNPKSLGTSLARSAAKQGPSIRDAALRRLILIGRQSPTSVHRLLPHTTRQLRKQGIVIDWTKLIDDLAAWQRHRRSTARRWIQDYHRELQRIDTDKTRNTATDTESETS